MTPSPNNTVIFPGTGAVIIDKNGDHWEISAGLMMLIDGLRAAYSANVARAAYVNHVVWHENTSSQWYSWNGTNWIAGSDPLPATPPPPSTIEQQILAAVQQNAAAIAALRTDLDAFEAQVIKILTQPRIAFAAPTFTKQPAPTKPGP